MPEYPDITVYIERLEALVVGQPLEQIRFASPFFLRTAEPPIKSIHGAVVHGFKRIGKRIVFVLDDERFLVLYLMENPVRFAASRFNAFATRPKKPTTAPSARPAANCWRTGRCPVC